MNHPLEDLSVHLSKAYVDIAEAFNATFPPIGDAHVISKVRSLMQEAADKLEHAKSLVASEIGRSL